MICKDCKIDKQNTEFDISNTYGGRDFRYRICRTCKEIRDNATTKLCKDCGEEKILDLFYTHTRSYDGQKRYSVKCKKCSNNDTWKREKPRCREPERREYINNWKKKQVKENTLHRVKSCLLHDGFTAKDLKFIPEIIEVKRRLLILKKEIKNHGS